MLRSGSNGSFCLKCVGTNFKCKHKYKHYWRLKRVPDSYDYLAIKAFLLGSLYILLEYNIRLASPFRNLVKLPVLPKP